METVAEDNPNRYFENGHWREFEIERQEIAVREHAAEALTIRKTVRGPVLSAFVPALDDGPRPVLSLRWVSAEGTTGLSLCWL